MSTLPEEHKPRTPDAASEGQLLEIRREAEKRGILSGRGIRRRARHFRRRLSRQAITVFTC